MANASRTSGRLTSATGSPIRQAISYIDTWWRHDPAGFHALVGGRVRTYAIDGELNGADVSRVLPDKCGNLWITTTSAGLIKAAPERIQRYTTRDGTADQSS